MKRSVSVALCLLALVACGPSAQPAHVVGTVTYQVSGGFTGWDRTLIVDQDGTAHLKFGSGPTPAVSPVQVDAPTLRRLHELVAGDDFASLGHAYLPPPGGADLQDYVVTAEVDGRQRLTMTRDGAQRPQILQDVMQILNAILVLATSGAAA